MIRELRKAEKLDTEQYLYDIDENENEDED